MTDHAGRKAPGRAAYLLGCLPLVLGFVVMGVVLAMTLPKLNDGLQQVVVPGSAPMTLEAGTHTVFLEMRSVVDGRAYVVDEVGGLQVRVTGPDGAAVTVGQPNATSTYSLNGREGRSIGAFEIATPGVYEVSADYAGGDGPPTVIAVGQGFVGALLGLVFTALGAVFVGFFLALGVIAWVMLRRRKAGHPA